MCALFLAAYQGSVKGTTALLSRGVNDVNQRSTDGLTALMMSASRGHSQVARILVNNGANVDLANSDGFTALHVAVQHGYVDVVVVLVQAGAPMGAQTRTGHTPLHLASQYGHTEVTTLLMEAGANLKAKTHSGFTPLHLAAQNGRTEVMTLLVEAGASDMAVNTSQGFTPLHLAAQNGHSTVVTSLVKAGADPTAAKCTGSCYTPLHLAAQNGHSVVTKLLMEAGGEHEATSSQGYTPLHLAAQFGHLEVMASLIDAGAALDAATSLGATPLHMAAPNRDSAGIIALVKAGANPTKRASTGETPLQVALAHGLMDTVKFLLEQQQPGSIGWGVHVNNADCRGQTSLVCCIQACHSNSPRFVRMLVDAGANTTSAVRVPCTQSGERLFKGTLLSLANRYLRDKKVLEKDATEEQLNTLEGIRRVLLQVEAVHALSWLWHNNVPSIINAAENKQENKLTSTSLRMTMPILRRRARRRGVVMAPLLRFSSGSGRGDM